MPSMSCACTDVMMATCDVPEASYAPIAVCALLALLLWQRYENGDEQEGDAPAQMYS